MLSSGRIAWTCASLLAAAAQSADAPQDGAAAARPLHPDADPAGLHGGDRGWAPRRSPAHRRRPRWVSFGNNRDNSQRTRDRMQTTLGRKNRPQLRFWWWARRGSNPEPTDYESRLARPYRSRRLPQSPRQGPCDAASGRFPSQPIPRHAAALPDVRVRDVCKHPLLAGSRSLTRSEMAVHWPYTRQG